MEPKATTTYLTLIPIGGVGYMDSSSPTKSYSQNEKGHPGVPQSLDHSVGGHTPMMGNSMIECVNQGNTSSSHTLRPLILSMSNYRPSWIMQKKGSCGVYFHILKAPPISWINECHQNLKLNNLL